MGNYGKAVRLKRILRPGRASLVVAFDHALVLGPIPGTNDPASQIQRFVEANADAILVNLGNIGHFAQAISETSHPGLIARLDWTTGFNEAAKTQSNGFQTCLVATPDDAIRAGADAVITFLVIGSGDAEFERKEVERVGRLARSCESLGMPLIVESIARGRAVEDPRNPKWLMLHTRMAAELGADAIKTENATDVESLRKVIQACPVPVLVLGGGRTGSDQEILEVVRGIVGAGAAGIFFGRNIFQSDRMAELIKNIRSLLSSAPHRES